jgi:hypothetical protein
MEGPHTSNPPDEQEQHTPTATPEPDTSTGRRESADTSAGDANRTADAPRKRRRPGLVIGPTTGDADVQLEW